MQIIDSHHHLWRYSPEQYGWINEQMKVLKRDFLSPELNVVAVENQVAGFVSVQARQSLEETDWLLELAASEPLIRGVVGWLPLADPGIAGVLERFQESPLLKGVRHVVQDEPDDRFLLGEQFNAGISCLSSTKLVYDILIYSKQLPAAVEFARQHSNIPMVLDHIAKPTIQRRSFDGLWDHHIRELARLDHVACKFSGVATEVRDSEWDIELIRPYWDVALESFGADRIMFGSDWPVCLLRTDYSRWVDTVRQLIEPLSGDEKEAILAGNARRVYRLD